MAFTYKGASRTPGNYEADYGDSDTGRSMSLKDFRKGPSAGISINSGKMDSSFPSQAEPVRAHEGSQSTSPTKEGD